mmetsp:Transcript_8176/g.13899  ORF Transcript_8176/g.13899 Transcript_8176/m.13899 type:complete len:91 (-) Transcript_8176:1337-1609(-)
MRFERCLSARLQLIAKSNHPKATPKSVCFEEDNFIIIIEERNRQLSSRFDFKQSCRKKQSPAAGHDVLGRLSTTVLNSSLVTTMASLMKR